METEGDNEQQSICPVTGMPAAEMNILATNELPESVQDLEKRQGLGEEEHVVKDVTST